MKHLRLGTRGSVLARIQTDMVADALARAGVTCEVVPIATRGDVQHDAPIHAIGGVGAFVKELDEAVRDGRVDAAVHSLKDVPTIERDGLALAAVLPRDAPGDALVGAPSLSALAVGARVGTSSLRRRAQLLRARGDLRVLPLRGNVPTRIERVERGDLEAVLLSQGGLVRLGYGARGHALDCRAFPHAPGQGVVAVVAAEGSPAARGLRAIDDAATRLAAESERLVMRLLGGGCLAPIGVYAEVAGPDVRVDAQALSIDGREAIEASASFAASGAVAGCTRLAEDLRARGASRLLERARS